MGDSDVVVDGASVDLSEALRDIRAAYDRLTQNNKIEVEQFYKAKVSRTVKFVTYCLTCITQIDCKPNIAHCS